MEREEAKAASERQKSKDCELSGRLLAEARRRCGCVSVNAKLEVQNGSDLTGKTETNERQKLFQGRNLKKVYDLI